VNVGERSYFQSGKDEGKLIRIEAIFFIEKLLGFDTNDSRWNNYHDTELEELSKIVSRILELK